MRLLAIVPFALLASACGASVHTSTSGQPSNSPGAAAYRYADCMRAHGLANFPDPRVSVSGGSVRVAMVAPATFAAEPQFKSAQKACQGILPAPAGGGPGQGSQGPPKAALLAFARCLRTHGIPNFPDPNAQGQLTSEMISAAGVNLHAPGVFPAARACVGVTHGAITVAQVAQAINGPH